jgi:hypothetical protein
LIELAQGDQLYRDSYASSSLPKEGYPPRDDRGYRYNNVDNHSPRYHTVPPPPPSQPSKSFSRDQDDGVRGDIPQTREYSSGRNYQAPRDPKTIQPEILFSVGPILSIELFQVVL